MPYSRSVSHVLFKHNRLYHLRERQQKLPSHRNQYLHPSEQTWTRVRCQMTVPVGILPRWTRTRLR